VVRGQRGGAIKTFGTRLCRASLALLLPPLPQSCTPRLSEYSRLGNGVNLSRIPGRRKSRHNFIKYARYKKVRVPKDR